MDAGLDPGLAWDVLSGAVPAILTGGYITPSWSVAPPTPLRDPGHIPSAERLDSGWKRSC